MGSNLASSWKRGTRIHAALATAAVLLASSAAVGPSVSTGASTAPSTIQKSAVGVSPGAGFFLDPVHLQRGLDDFKTLGARWIRSSIPWHNFQPADPRSLPVGAPLYSWKGVDAFVATINNAANAGHFSLIVTVDGPPAWAQVKSRIAPIACADQAPFDLGSYASAIAALAVHLHGTAGVFELENSPNIALRGAAHVNSVAVWPTPNPCGYAQLLKQTYAAVKAVQPDAIVLVGGIGGVRDVAGGRIAADEYLAGLYANGAQGSFDGVSYHPYSTPSLTCDPADVICTFNPSTLNKDPYGMKNGWDRMLNARAIMVAHGDGAKSMWITEFGGATQGPVGSTATLTEAQQAALLLNGFERASQYSWVAMMDWFTYQDKGTNPQTDKHGDWMGLVRSNYSRKPAFATYVAMVAAAS